MNKILVSLMMLSSLALASCHHVVISHRVGNSVPVVVNECYSSHYHYVPCDRGVVRYSCKPVYTPRPVVVYNSYSHKSNHKHNHSHSHKHNHNHSHEHKHNHRGKRR